MSSSIQMKISILFFLKEHGNLHLWFYCQPWLFKHPLFKEINLKTIIKCRWLSCVNTILIIMPVFVLKTGSPPLLECLDSTWTWRQICQFRVNIQVRGINRINHIEKNSVVIYKCFFSIKKWQLHPKNIK